MALWGPNGDAAFIATIREGGLKQRSWAWLGWLLSSFLTVMGIWGESWVLGLFGIAGLSWMTYLTIRNVRLRRRRARLHRSTEFR